MEKSLVKVNGINPMENYLGKVNGVKHTRIQTQRLTPSNIPDQIPMESSLGKVNGISTHGCETHHTNSQRIIPFGYPMVQTPEPTSTLSCIMKHDWAHVVLSWGPAWER